MQILSSEAIIAKIKAKKCFECTTTDKSLHIRITEYAPLVATAIHNGHQFGDDLQEISRTIPSQRLQHEAPLTGEFISSLPITMVALDSCISYDLNMSPAECIPQQLSGESVWQQPLDDELRAQSLRKHFTWYSILKTLADVTQKTYGICIIYDVHAFNYQHLESGTPVFNLGSHFINKQKWRKEVERFSDKLAQTSLPNMTVTAAINEISVGRGYLAQFCREQLTDTLCLPLYIKKIYMDELTGEQYPLVIEQLKEVLKQVIFEHANDLVKRKSRQQRISVKKLLGSKISAELKSVDKKLFDLAKDLSTLSYLNPINLKAEKKRFFKRPYDYTPDFRYRQLDIDPYRFKEQLYSLPVHLIQDASIEHLYKRVIEQLAMRIDMLTKIGTPEFLYNSLRYYGQPMDEDLNNANFILHARVHDTEQGDTIDNQTALKLFTERSHQYGIRCKIQSTDKIVAGAIVDGLTLKINNNKVFRLKELEGLIEHELGVHLVTSANATEQPLQVFKIGLPGNTHTQEGLAILSEHLTGNMTVSRLKTLALRVVSVNQMLHGASFNELYFELLNRYQLNSEKAFAITTRVFRGGGFTKDYLYLSGLKNALRLSKSSDLTPLLIGKTAFEFLPLLQELIDREIVRAPRFTPNAFVHKAHREPIVDYLISSIH